jgi:hypothetical protein
MSTSLLQNPDPIKTAIISYDLKNAQGNDNQRVKQALTELYGTYTRVEVLDNTPFPRWVTLQLPDTTLLWSIADPNITTEHIARSVAHVIRQQGAEVNKIYVAFLSTSDAYLINE